MRLEFGAAGVDAFIDRDDAAGEPLATDLVFRTLEQIGDPGVGETVTFDLAEQVGRHRGQIILLEFILQIDDLLQLVQEPWIDPGQFVDLVERPVAFEGGVQVVDPLGVGDDQLAPEGLVVDVADIG